MVRSYEVVKPFLVKVNLVAKIMQSAYLSQAQKITISRGFNLLSNSW